MCVKDNNGWIFQLMFFELGVSFTHVPMMTLDSQKNFKPGSGSRKYSSRFT